MGQTADINGLVGKRISYHDGFTDCTFTYTIDRIEAEGHGYKMTFKEDPNEFYFLGESSMQKLLATGHTATVDHNAYRETFTIQG